MPPVRRQRRASARRCAACRVSVSARGSTDQGPAGEKSPAEVGLTGTTARPGRVGYSPSVTDPSDRAIACGIADADLAMPTLAGLVEQDEAAVAAVALQHARHGALGRRLRAVGDVLDRPERRARPRERLAVARARAGGVLVGVRPAADERRVADAARVGPGDPAGARRRRELAVGVSRHRADGVAALEAPPALELGAPVLGDHELRIARREAPRTGERRCSVAGEQVIATVLEHGAGDVDRMAKRRQHRHGAGRAARRRP